MCPLLRYEHTSAVSGIGDVGVGGGDDDGGGGGGDDLQINSLILHKVQAQACGNLR